MQAYADLGPVQREHLQTEHIIVPLVKTLERYAEHGIGRDTPLSELTSLVHLLSALVRRCMLALPPAKCATMPSLLFRQIHYLSAALFECQDDSGCHPCLGRVKKSLCIMHDRLLHSATHGAKCLQSLWLRQMSAALN